MESTIQKVKDIDPDKKQWLEARLQQRLDDDQRVLIAVLKSDVPADNALRQKAADTLQRLAEKGTRYRQKQGVSEEQADVILEEAIRHARRTDRSE